MTNLVACFMLIYTAHLASASSILPHPVRHNYRSKPDRSPSYIRHGSLPKHFNLDYIDVSPYENNPYRRVKYLEFDNGDIPYFLQKQSKKRVIKVDKEFEKEEGIPLFLQKQSKKRGNINVDKTKKYDKLFDDNGILWNKRVNKVDKEFDNGDIPLFLHKQSKKRVNKMDNTKKYDKLFDENEMLWKKRGNIQDDKFENEDIPLFLKKQTKKRVNKVDNTKKYDKLFDENGMLYLTQPEDLEDRKLNRLLNKVVQYNMDKKNKFLRKPLTKVFKPNEIRQLKKIARALDETSTMRTEFEFAELVQ